MKDYSKLSDEELIEEVAVKVMVWRKGKHDCCSLCVAWLEDTGLNNEEEKIMGWFKVCSQCYHDVFDPLEDWNGTMQVWAKINYTEQKFKEEAYDILFETLNPQRAILLAALNA